MRRSIRRRAGLAAVALGLSTATLGFTGSTASAAPGDPIPPLGCGVTRAETGPLSKFIHGLEPGLLGLGLAGPVHGLNCTVVLDVEYLLGFGAPNLPGPGPG